MGRLDVLDARMGKRGVMLDRLLARQGKVTP